MLEKIEIDGRTATLVYLDENMKPVEMAQAALAKAVFENGDTVWLVKEKQDYAFDPNQERDPDGK